LRRKTWLIVATVVLAAVFSYVGFFLLKHQVVDSLTVSELRSLEVSYDQQWTVEGKVAPGSIDWESKTKVIRFVLTDDKETLIVVYNGIVPDNFKPGADLTVEGMYNPDGIFEAHNFGRPISLCRFCH
jgi:cytochrome c-type biogenesis protein CcmE